MNTIKPMRTIPINFNWFPQNNILRKIKNWASYVAFTVYSAHPKRCKDNVRLFANSFENQFTAGLGRGIEAVGVGRTGLGNRRFARFAVYGNRADINKMFDLIRGKKVS